MVDQRLSLYNLIGLTPTMQRFHKMMSVSRSIERFENILYRNIFAYRIIGVTLTVLLLPFLTLCFNLNDIKIVKEQLVNLRKK